MVKKTRRRSILTLAKEIYDDQRDYETPPAEMEDVTELLLLLAKKVVQLESQVKTLQKQTEPQNDISD